MIIRRVGPMSFAKRSGMLYALLGLCFGAILSLIAMIGATASFNENNAAAAGFGAIFGVGAIILLPILYGAAGFIFSLIGAALYNLVAGWVGGVELEVQ